MQHTADKLPEDLFIRVIIQNVHKGSNRTVQAAFNSLLLGDEVDSSDSDLDLGINDLCNRSYLQSSVWGLKYFKDNFRRFEHSETNGWSGKLPQE